MTARDDALRLYGTDEPVPEPQVVRAGALSCEIVAGSVRCVRWHEVEVLRGVAYLLRDRNWGTAPCQVAALQVHEAAHRFDVRFELQMTLAPGVLTAQARIEGRADGHFSFSVEATADGSLSSSRCGFVVLHPAACAGLALEVTHTDGAVQVTRFPPAISPGQPVFDIRALRWAPQPGLSASCRLSADLPGRPDAKFEMEDQRNWSDASFKTYVGSLLDPWPYDVPPGVALRQAVVLELADTRPAAGATARPGAAEPLRFGAPTGQSLPVLGLGVPHLDLRPGPHEQAAVQALRPGWLVVELDLTRSDVAAQLALAAGLAAGSGAAIQLDVLCADADTPEAVAAQVRQACVDAGVGPAGLRLCPRAYLKSYQPTDRWPDVAPLAQYARVARAAFPAARIGGGMVTNFTELNRYRQGPDAIDFIAHSSCPIVHAADERSVMETLETLPAMAGTVREVWPGLGWRIGPLALAAARNPYGSGVLPNPAGRRLALASHDPRHHGRFGAAWCAGCAAVLAPLGVELMTLLHSHGPSGPLLAAMQPDWHDGATVPAWAVLRELARWRGRALVAVQGVPDGVLALASRGNGGDLQALLVNTTAAALDLHLAAPMTAAAPGGEATAPVACVPLPAYGVVVVQG